MIDTAAVFVTDNGFLVPSLVAARQLCKFGAHKKADIMLFAVGVDSDLLRRLDEDFGADFKIIPLKDESFKRFEDGAFYKNHVPDTALARLVIADKIDARYRNLVYFDGDIQILRDPSDLLTAEVPEGYIGAAPGGSWLEVLENRPHHENLAKLGLDPATYFNSGVFAVSRETWLEKGPEALRFFQENPEKCKVHDQTALNVVFKDKVKLISPTYNFHHVYAESGVTRSANPRIVHFTGPNKPWSGFPPPWFGGLRSCYAEFLEEFPYLSGYLSLSRPYSRRHIRSRIASASKKIGEKRKMMELRASAVLERLSGEEFFVN